jgi:hypothetical protein
MMNHARGNLEVLYDRHPELRTKAIEDARPPADLEVVETPSGLPTARLRGAYLHSRYDPLKEARRVVASQAGAAPSAAIVLGFGLGYLVEAFCEAFPGTPLLVIEQESGMFLRALAARDLKRLLCLPAITWCIGEQAESVVMNIDRLPLQQLCILRLRALLALRPEYYRRVEALLFSVLDKREVNVNTLRRFGQLWVRNLLSNLRRFTAHPGILAGQGRFTGIPALVLAAGPSLDEVLPLLGALRERLLIVAVDTSYRFCRYRGVEPDFLVTVDPQYWNSRHLDWLGRPQAALISESSAHPRLFRSLEEQNGEIYFVSSFFPLGRCIEEIIGERGLIGAGGSVATTAWDLCRYLGCSPIYMAGLDLGFPGKRTHARGAFFEQAMHTRSRRFQPAEQMIFEYLHQARPTSVRNNAGGRTLTDRRMLIYKSWFENQIRQQSGRGGPATYALAAEAVAMEGIEYMQPSELVGLPHSRERVDSALSELKERGRAMAETQQPDRVVQRLKGLAGELEQLEKLAARGARLASGRQPGSAVVPLLEQIDREIMALASRQIAGFLFQPLIHRILEAPEAKPDFFQVLAASKELYRELMQSAGYHRGLLRKHLERL